MAQESRAPWDAWGRRIWGGRGVQYPLSHTRVDCLAPAILIAFAMPSDFSCLFSIGSKHYPGVVFRQGQVDIPETQSLAGPHHGKGHTRAVQFGACGRESNERGSSEFWSVGRGPTAIGHAPSHPQLHTFALRHSCQTSLYLFPPNCSGPLPLPLTFPILNRRP